MGSEVRVGEGRGGLVGQGSKGSKMAVDSRGLGIGKPIEVARDKRRHPHS